MKRHTISTVREFAVPPNPAIYILRGRLLPTYSVRLDLSPNVQSSPLHYYIGQTVDLYKRYIGHRSAWYWESDSLRCAVLLDLPGPKYRKQKVRCAEEERFLAAAARLRLPLVNTLVPEDDFSSLEKELLRLQQALKILAASPEEQQTRRAA
jgi:hypothetical protein